MNTNETHNSHPKAVYATSVDWELKMRMEMGAEWFNLNLGRHQGLNADWSVQAWRVCGQLWIIDNEDGTFSFAQRTPTADGGWDVHTYGEIKL